MNNYIPLLLLLTTGQSVEPSAWHWSIFQSASTAGNKPVWGAFGAMLYILHGVGEMYVYSTHNTELYQRQ